MGRIAASLLAALTLLGLSWTPARAQAGPWVETEVVKGRLIAAVAGVGRLETIPVGLQLELAEGWKTYWRSPGDAGLPPRVDWSGSENLQEATFRWPAPRRFALFGFDNFGYESEVVFPLDVVPIRAGEPVALRGRVELLVCSEICVPSSLDVTLDLAAGPPLPAGPTGNLIARFAAQVPGDGAASGLDLVAAAAVPGEAGRDLRIEATARDPWQDPDIFVETDEGVAFAAPDIVFRDGRRRLIATLRPYESKLLDGETTPVTVTVVDGARALERALDVRPIVATGAAPASGFVTILGLALLGGLILNLMPCVLPVLSLKLMSVLRHQGHERRQIRRGFLASAAGILFSIWLLAGGLIVVKALGGTVGWGIQFQQPLFLVAMILLLTLFACNLLGLFDVGLPRRMSDWVQQESAGSGLKGHFATGAFATLLATPCSAPFLGTAVGFALAGSAAEIFAIFTALGVGLAVPYLLVAAAPGVVRWLPRPGRWIVVLRRVLSLALVATAVWLLSILANQLSPTGVGVVAGLAALTALALWSRPRLRRAWRPAGGVAVGLLLLGALSAPILLERSGVQGPTAAAASYWQAFDRAEIDRLVGEGRVVFVDVTADWCITCKANKALVIDRGEVAARLRGGAIVPMQADWTLPDDAISAYLASYGRYGIPFNAVYGPAAPDGIVLPEILTEDAVLDAFERAGGGPEMVSR